MQIKTKQIAGFAQYMQEYTLLRGRAGGQQIIGGTGYSENLLLESNSSDNKGTVVIQPNGGGTVIGIPVGGDQGDGTVNAQGVFVNGDNVQDHARRIAFFHG